LLRSPWPGEIDNPLRNPIFTQLGTLPPLLAAHDRSITQNDIGAQNQHTPGEVELLTTYRNASEAGKSALNKVASAIRTQTMSAWFSAGMAVSEAANIFDKKK
jgi:hypothetical protein